MIHSESSSQAQGCFLEFLQSMILKYNEHIHHPTSFVCLNRDHISKERSRTSQYRGCKLILWGVEGRWNQFIHQNSSIAKRMNIIKELSSSMNIALRVWILNMIYQVRILINNMNLSSYHQEKEFYRLISKRVRLLKLDRISISCMPYLLPFTCNYGSIFMF